MRSGRMRRKSRNTRLINCVVDALESRRLLTGEYLATPLPALLANLGNPSANNVTLNRYFNDTTLPGTLVTFNTSLSSTPIQVGLTDAATPQTVANFLSYVNSQAYNQTFYHRSVDISTSQGGSPEAPATIIQGGGYAVMNGSLGHITTSNPVPDEYESELYGDVAGTLAMAKTSAPDSATSEFYFNVSDNTELDTPTTYTDPTTGETTQTSYTVFGQVLSGMSVIQDIAALPVADLGTGLEDVPVTGLTEAQIAAGAGVSESNIIFNDTITSQPGTTYNVSSDNSALVTPTITDGVLSFAYSSTLSGTAEISITAKNLDGTSTSSTMEVTVPNPATPTAGPLAINYTAPVVVIGNTGNFSILTNDTDSLAAFDLSTIKILSGPTNGTATIDSTTGHLIYTPNAGYTGPDSVTYTIADVLGNVSNVGTVDLSVVPGPVKLTIGTAVAKSLVYTDPTGIVATITVGDGTADITFTDYQVTLKTINGVVHASGEGAAITNINMINRGPFGTITVKANGPITIGSFDCVQMKELNAPTATITGVCNIGGIAKVILAAANNATLNLGKVIPTGLSITNVSDTSVNASTGILYIKSKQWVNTDGRTYGITGTSLFDLEVTGVFADTLTLSSGGYALYKANVAAPAAPWNLSGGSLNKAVVATPGANWGLLVAGVVSSLTVKGNLGGNNNIQSAAIGIMSVTGTTTGISIQTDGTFNKRGDEIDKIAFGGAVNQLVIFSDGNIGAISAPSLTDSRIYAGVAVAVAQAGKLAAAATDLTSDSHISSITLGKGANAFADSLISADILSSLKLGKINTSNNSTPEGVSAHQYGSISETIGAVVLNAGAAQTKTSAKLLAYETLKKVTTTDLGDFAVNYF